jgi:UDP-N-acetylglucosamine transferase subunit ALG13
MIFVTVGSTKFTDLIRKMDELAPSLGDDVVMQIGDGPYDPKNCSFFRFAASLDPYYDQADLIVAHGGLGTIVEVSARGKKLVCVVNPTTMDLHQEHLLRIWAEKNYFLWCKDLEQLAVAIQQAREMQFARYQSPECHIHEVIKDYLEGPERHSPLRGRSSEVRPKESSEVRR